MQNMQIWCFELCDSDLFGLRFSVNAEIDFMTMRLKQQMVSSENRINWPRHECGNANYTSLVQSTNRRRRHRENELNFAAKIHNNKP